MSLGLLATGCGGRKPDATALLAKQASATRHIAASVPHFAAATTNLRTTSASHARAVVAQSEATKWVTLLVPAVDSLLLRAPADLKPEVEKIKAQVESLRLAIEATVGPMAQTTKGLSETQAELAAGSLSLSKGAAEIDEINRKLGPEYFAKVEELAKHDGTITARLDKVVGWGGLVLAAFAALGATRFVGLSPASWGIPVGVFALVYAASFFLGRFWL